MMSRRFAMGLTGSLLALAMLGCGMSLFIPNVAPLSGPVYWAAATDTLVPTMTQYLGMTTPVYAPTQPGAVLTTVPFWTTVTATPYAPPPTATPWGFTATPFWVTTTPEYITTTPQPPVTTTPGLPMIGFTTPRPPATPYYRVGSFYMHSDVYIGGPNGLILRVIDHTNRVSERDPAVRYHYLTVRLTNRSAEPVTMIASDLFFVRQVVQDGTPITGRWTPQNEPILAVGLPDYAAQETDPLPPDATRDITLGFVLPVGDVPEVGLITDWQRPVEGGQPVWFYLRSDPDGPFVDADQPPPPTPAILDDDSAQSGGGGGGIGVPVGRGMWPTTGTITRGFGCHSLFTGIDGAGFGCPAERPWFHNGVDVANVSGTAVWSPVDGAITYAGPNPTGPDCSGFAGSEPPHNGLGNYQKVQGASTLHYFGHLSSFTQTAGAVSAGQTTAGMGSTGCSTGTHLHWIVYENGALIDPAQWAGPGPQP